MKKKKKVRTVANHMNYKKQTGSAAEPKSDVMKMAAEVRAKGSAMTDEQRQTALHYGMRLIYGGNSHVAAKVGSA